MKPQERPSKKQKELLNFIQAFISEHGYGPSYREIMRGANYKSVSTVAVHVDNLIAKGHLRKRDHSARSLEVVGEEAGGSSASKDVLPAQEKWLVNQIAERFGQLESTKPSQKDIDDLFVLVGALHVLGFTEAAQSFKDKLAEIAKH